MNITSLFFLAFVAGILLIYYVVPRNVQWLVLLAASVIFYIAADVRYLAFLFTIIVITYVIGHAISRLNGKQKETLKAGEYDREQKKKIKEEFKKKKKRFMVFGVLAAIGMLVVVKYTNFLLGNAVDVINLFGLDVSAPHFKLVLPLAISFYSFQSVSMIVDVYRDKVVPEKNFLKFSLYLCYFPQLQQGPISRYNDLFPQLMAPHEFESTNLIFGAELLLYGLFKKLVIADRINVVYSTVFPNFTAYGRYELVMGLILYSIQMYCDFSGCMDIIGGVSEMFGIKLAKNFLHPYFSKTMPEFWRRWHATLGSWFKDYVYYPISVSKFSQNLNRFCRQHFGNNAGRIVSGIVPIYVVWLCTGIWHGASWSFVFWGVFHGTMIALSLIFTPMLDKFSEKCKINRDCFSFRLFQMTRTYLICCVGRIFFVSGSLRRSFKMMAQIVTMRDPWVLVNGSVFEKIGLSSYETAILAIAILVLLVVSNLQEKFSVREKLAEQNLVFRWMIVFAAIFGIFVFGKYGAGFNASNFLYRDF